MRMSSSGPVHEEKPVNVEARLEKEDSVFLESEKPDAVRESSESFDSDNTESSPTSDELESPEEPEPEPQPALTVKRQRSHRAELPSAPPSRNPIVVGKRIVHSLIENVIKPVVEVSMDVGYYWLTSGTKTITPSIILRQSIIAQMNAATTYDEWRSFALELDHLDGWDRWKMRFESTEYDYVLIRDCLDDLYRARKSHDVRRALYLLRNTLDRNIGNLMSDDMYKCATGTKDLAEQYIDEAVYQIHALSRATMPGMSHADLTHEFVFMRQVYGRSALLLSGGGGLGIYHLGVVKALFEADLLPRIISGSSAGAIAASMLCAYTDDELAEFCTQEIPPIKSPYFFSREHETVVFRERLARLFREGTLADVEVLKDCLRENLGDITFQEAYDRTNRILNVSVNSNYEHDVPRVLNYVTAPNVVIWSAVCASCALKTLFDPVQILTKDKHGRMRPWNPPGVLWSDGSIQSDLPAQRLSELFNVNHFIVSQGIQSNVLKNQIGLLIGQAVNPHIVPVLKRSAPVSRALSVVASELDFQFERLVRIRLLPQTLLDLKNIISQKYTGHITILPDYDWQDYANILANPLPAVMERGSHVGQHAAWKQMSRISNHCKIEIALDDVVRRLKGNERWTMN